MIQDFKFALRQLVTAPDLLRNGNEGSLVDRS
jgi:hypothetical protein